MTELAAHRALAANLDRPKTTPVHPADDPTLSPEKRAAGRMIRRTDAVLDALDGGEGR